MMMNKDNRATIKCFTAVGVIVSVLSSKSVFADDSAEMTRVMRNQAENGFQIIDETGLRSPEAEPVHHGKRTGNREVASRLPPSASRKPFPDSPPTPLPLWNGLYGGLNAGGTFGGSSLNTDGTDLFDTGRSFFGAASVASASNKGLLNKSGFIGGGQIGYNFQVSDRFVGGFEADIQGLSLAGGETSWSMAKEAILGIPLATITNASKSLNYLGTVRGRVGYLIAPTLLAYATGGLAYGNASARASFLQYGIDNSGQIGSALSANAFSNTRTGWTVGAGGEWMFFPHWSAKLEYLYYDLGGVSIVNELAGSNPFFNNIPLYQSILSSSTRFNGHVVRVGLNYQLPVLLSSIPFFVGN
jgi:outer membrane immunogenic protein